MDFISEYLRANPLIAVFLTLGLGFWLGKLRIGTFNLGAVAATLIVGVVIGQTGVAVPDMLKSVFFLLFLFSTGYSVGPQFVRSFRKSGWKQMVFAVVEALVCAGTVLVAAWALGYDSGIATGLYAGSQTASACLGMVGDTVREMPLDGASREYMLSIIPACYAATYVLGTIASAWYLSTVGPKLMGGLAKVKEEVASIEQELDRGTRLQPGQMLAGRPVIFRAFRLQGKIVTLPANSADIEEALAQRGMRVFVERARTGGIIVNPGEDTMLREGDTVVFGGLAEDVIRLEETIGPDTSDAELLSFAAQKTPVTVSARGADGVSVGKLREQSCMQRVMIASISRGGRNLPVKCNLELNAGDVVVLVGWPCDVERAAQRIGFADPQSNMTDMVFLGLGIAAGCILGTLSLRLHGVPMAVGSSVGALVAGMAMGWWRSRRPTFGHIPESSLWLLSNLGINMFIAVIGLTAGASLGLGLEKAGWWIIPVGLACTLAGLTLSVVIGRRLFRFSAPETLGCVAGARCSVASIGAVEDVLQSDVPNLGYTVTYAVANVALVFSALLVLFLT